MRIAKLLPAGLIAFGACAHAPRPAVGVATVPAPAAAPAVAAAEVMAAIGSRVVQLKARGGDCLAEAEVLDRALTTGRITVIPFMWRDGTNLASARGEADGQLTVARDIDSLNVGVRGLDDVLWSAEHEAVHIASKIPSGTPVGEALIDEQVRACRSTR